MSQIWHSNRIFLIALHPVEKFSFIGESHGVCAISGYLLENYKNTLVSVYDQQFFSLDYIVNEILKKRPAIVGISIKIFTFEQFLILYELISKRVFPLYKPNLMIGNSVPHFSGEEILKKYCSDVIISLGEGEISVSDFYEYILNQRNHSDVRNIMYMKNGEIIRSQFEYLNKNKMTSADRRYSLKYYTSGGEVYIEGSRGCAYCACSICECRYFLGSCTKDFKWRDRPIHSIVDELERLVSQGIHVVTFSDEDFLGSDNYGLERAINISQEIISRGIKIGFRINARVKSIYNKYDDDNTSKYKKYVLSNLKKSGLVKIFLGFESGVQKQINRYNKGFNLKEFLNVKSILIDLNIDFELGFICLDPLMTIEELKENIQFIKTNGCIPFISSIYKELRIQRGNISYIKKIHDYEKIHGKKIIGDLNFNAQQYEILEYADPKVEKLRTLMYEYDRKTYRVYYLIRILTQYSQDNDEFKKIIYQSMREIKNNDFELISSLVEKLQKNENDKYLNESLHKYDFNRENIYLNILGFLNDKKENKYKNLANLISDIYCHN